MAKKNSAKEIEKEEVSYEEEVGGESGGSGGESFFAKNRIPIIIALIVAIGGGYFLYNKFSKNTEANMTALADMSMAEVQFHQDSIQRSIDERAAFYGFMEITDSYKGTDAANLANYYIGTGKMKMGQIDEGISYLEEFDKGDNMVSGAAYAALGFAYEQKMDFSTAADNYLKASSTPEENDFTTPMYLLEAARNQQSAGNAGEALTTFRRVKKDYPNYPEVANGNVDKYIYMLDLDADA